MPVLIGSEASVRYQTAAVQAPRGGTPAGARKRREAVPLGPRGIAFCASHSSKPRSIGGQLSYVVVRIERAFKRATANGAKDDPAIEIDMASTSKRSTNSSMSSMARWAMGRH